MAAFPLCESDSCQLEFNMTCERPTIIRRDSSPVDRPYRHVLVYVRSGLVETDNDGLTSQSETSAIYQRLLISERSKLTIPQMPKNSYLFPKIERVVPIHIIPTHTFLHGRLTSSTIDPVSSSALSVATIRLQEKGRRTTIPLP